MFFNCLQRSKKAQALLQKRKSNKHPNIPTAILFSTDPYIHTGTRGGCGVVSNLRSIVEVNCRRRMKVIPAVFQHICTRIIQACVIRNVQMLESFERFNNFRITSPFHVGHYITGEFAKWARGIAECILKLLVHDFKHGVSSFEQEMNVLNIARFDRNVLWPSCWRLEE